jgi:hypothetical protein
MNPDRTGIVMPPPLLFAFPFFAGWWIGPRWEWSMSSDRPAALAVGAGFVMAGFVIAIASVRQFRSMAVRANGAPKWRMITALPSRRAA